MRKTRRGGSLLCSVAIFVSLSRRCSWKAAAFSTAASTNAPLLASFYFCACVCVSEMQSGDMQVRRRNTHTHMRITSPSSFLSLPFSGLLFSSGWHVGMCLVSPALRPIHHVHFACPFSACVCLQAPLLGSCFASAPRVFFPFSVSVPGLVDATEKV